MKSGATNYLNKIKYSYDIKYVPGTLEIPFILTSFSKYDGFIVLILSNKGETDHYDIVKNIALREIYKISYDKNLLWDQELSLQIIMNRHFHAQKYLKKIMVVEQADACHKLLSLINE